MYLVWKWLWKSNLGWIWMMESVCIVAPEWCRLVQLSAGHASPMQGIDARNAPCKPETCAADRDNQGVLISRRMREEDVIFQMHGG